MNRLALLCMLVLSPTAFANPPPASSPEFDFPDAVKLRNELLNRKDFDGFGMEGAEHKAIDKAHAAWKDGHGDRTLDILYEFLKKYPASIAGWRNAAEASEAWASIAKDPEHKNMFAIVGKREREIQAGLMQSIIDSEDGKSEKTAYPVLEISEEYELVAWLHLKPQSQSLLQSPTTGRSYDVLKLKDESGKDVVLYFDITNFWNAENRIFSEPVLKKQSIPEPAENNPPEKK